MKHLRYDGLTQPAKRGLFRLLFVFYTFLVLYATLLGRSHQDAPLNALWAGWLVLKGGKLQLRPLCNQLMLTPFTYLLCLSFPGKMRRNTLRQALCISFACTLFIERAQLIFSIGTFQVSDLTYNTLSGGLGALLYEQRRRRKNGGRAAATQNIKKVCAAMGKKITIPNRNSMSWLHRHIRRRIPALTLLMAMKITCSVFGVLLTLVIQSIIDNAAAGKQTLFLGYSAAMLAVIVVQIASSTCSLHLQELISADLERDFKKNLMHDILNSDFSSVSRYHSGDLLQRLNGDVSSVVTSIIAVASSAVSLGSGLIAALLVLTKLAPGFTVFIFGLCLVLAFLTLLVQRHMKELHKRVSAASGRVSGFFQEVIEKLLIVQALDVTDEIEARSEEMLEERWQIQRRRKNVSLAMNLGASVLGYAAAFVTMVWCAGKLLRGEMTFGTLTAMTSLVSQLQGPLLLLPTLIPRLVTIFASVERLMELENMHPQKELLAKRGKTLYDKLSRIEAKGLTFSYRGNIFEGGSRQSAGERRAVFCGADFSLPKGGLTVITGASGIGKSTLLKLLLGIYVPDSGSLLLEMADGVIPLTRAARNLFSYAPQGNLLLSGSIRENILLANTGADEAALQEAVYVSGMEEYVAALPDGLDTVLGENGAGLSEGQVQRISLARAVISGAPILLLDEVTSSLDAETERTVLERISALEGRTCIAVTHRPAALELADWELHITEDAVTLKGLRQNGIACD